MRLNIMNASQGVTVPTGMEGAVCYLAVLEILDEVIANKTSSKLGQDDIQAHTNFRVQLASTREKILHDSEESGLHAITNFLNRLKSTLYVESKNYNRLWSNIKASQSAAKSEISSFCLGETPEAHEISQWLWRSGHQFCNMVNGARKGRDIIPDKELSKTHISQTNYSDWAERLTRLLNAHREQLEKLLASHADVRKKTIDALNRHGSIVYCKGMSPPKSSRNISIDNAPVEALIFTNPPSLNELKLSDDLAYYLNLAEDVASGDIQLSSSYANDLIETYTGFMNSIAELDGAMVKNSQIQQCKNTLRWIDNFQPATSPGWAKSMVDKAIDRATKDKAEHSVKLAQCNEEIKRDNFDAAEKLLASITSNVPYTFDVDYKSASKAISDKNDVVAKTKKLIEQCLAEYTEKRKKLFGKQKAKDTVKLSLNRAQKNISDISFISGGQFSRQILGCVEQLREVEEWTEAQLKWGKHIELELLIATVHPKKQSPLSALVNIMCALAATDGSFDEEERKLIRRICIKNLKLSEPDINKHMVLWVKLTRQNGHDRNVAQSIVDVVNLKVSKYEASVEKCLEAIVRADGKLYEKEKAALKAATDHLR